MQALQISPTQSHHSTTDRKPAPKKILLETLQRESKGPTHSDSPWPFPASTHPLLQCALPSVPKPRYYSILGARLGGPRAPSDLEPIQFQAVLIKAKMGRL